MIKTHSLGFPRIGARRELKFALEGYWQGKTSRQALTDLGAELRQRHWSDQAALDLLPVGDFSFYDHVLDMSFLLNNLPERVRGYAGHEFDNYFRVARGRSALTPEADPSCEVVAAGDMTKWFDTNYHYIVPEFQATTLFELRASRLMEQVAQARALGIAFKPVIVGPVSYLWLGKSKDRTDRLALLPRLLPVYARLLEALAEAGADWVQIDEPVLATELDAAWSHALRDAYHQLKTRRVRLLVASYFGQLQDNAYLAANLPVDGLHIDAVNGRADVQPLLGLLPAHKVLSLGVIDGRNMWRTDLDALLDWIEPIAQRLGDRLWIAPSCSLLHVPVDLDSENEIDPELKSWLAFARQKLSELVLVARALNHGRQAVATELQAQRAALKARRRSPRVHGLAVDAAACAVHPDMGRRRSPYAERAPKQAARLGLPMFPTTTIGSFPQTAEIRRTRRQFKSAELSEDDYKAAMRTEIARCVDIQERLGLDVLVHGEAERNDMVEFFGERLEGYAFSQFGWVQSYGSRCVKPPILFGDVRRREPMTLEWARYASSLTRKPMKGMLTGPVTLLNWSFVRDDQARSATCRQLALAIRAEVLDLERAGVSIVQIDEAALREGLPLRRAQWDAYLAWAVDAFRIAANGVRDETQIHTHMCYSEFNDIIHAIAEMDADVITIETSRSDMALLQAFENFDYPNDIGPGVYDIHSPGIPSVEQIVHLMSKAAERLPAERLWVNPDCGLKTRQWDEVMPALANMVAAARALRQAHAPENS